MKKLLSLLLVAGFLALCSTAPAGCATGSTNSVSVTTYKVEQSLTVTVDRAMQTYGAWVHAGKSTAAQRQAVDVAFSTYLDALDAAAGALHASAGQPDSTSAIAAAVTSAAGDLLRIIQNLTSK